MLELLRRIGFTPRHCVWELTLACDLRCRHCGSRAGTARPDELTLEESLRVADQLVAAGCREVTLSGGEPSLRAGWERIGERLASQGVRLMMISNGFAWTREHAERARRAGLAGVAFSLDGLEGAHDAVRGAGAFRRALRAIDLSAEAGVGTSVVTHLNRLNARGLGELRALLAEHGVGGWQLQLGNPAGTMADHVELVLAPEDLLWLVPEIASLRAMAGAPALDVADNLGYFGRHETALRDRGAQIDFWVGCRAGCQVVGIESNGDVKGCLAMPHEGRGGRRFVEGNLRERTLKEIWESEAAFDFNRSFRAEHLTGFCGVCRYRDLCRGGCVWTSACHTTDGLDNPYCVYRQAVINRRFELLAEGDEPSAAELAFGAGGRVGPQAALGDRARRMV